MLPMFCIPSIKHGDQTPLACSVPTAGRPLSGKSSYLYFYLVHCQGSIIFAFKPVHACPCDYNQFNEIEAVRL